MQIRINHNFYTILQEISQEVPPRDLISWITSLSLRKWTQEKKYEKDFYNLSTTIYDIFPKSNFPELKKLSYSVPNENLENKLKQIWSLINTTSPSIVISSIVYYLPDVGKQELDQVFTPMEIVKHIVNSKEITKKTIELFSNNIFPKVLEPGCAHSPFLSTIYDSLFSKYKKVMNISSKELHIKLLDNLYGIELDFFTHLLGKISLVTKLNYKDHDDESLKVIPKLLIGDYLDYKVNDLLMTKKFDIIIGNPPYGQIKDKELKKLFEIKYEESTSGFMNVCGLFIHRSLLSLKSNGILHFLVASPILTSDYNKLLRKLLLSNGEIRSLLRFESRTDVCPGILQDFSIFNYQFNPNKKSNKIRIEWTKNLKTLDERKFNNFTIPNNYVILNEKDGYRFLVLPTKKDHEIFFKALTSKRLNELTKGASTGQIVQHRAKHLLTNKGTVLVKQQFLNKPRLKIKEIDNKSEYYDLTNQPSDYVFNNSAIAIKRLTSKEQPRRLHVTVIEGKNYCLDNKINYIKCSKNVIESLADYLQSDLAEYFFRGFSTTTQVNAKELNSIPTPDIGFLLKINKKTKDFESEVCRTICINQEDLSHIKSTLKNSKF